jgi:protein-disulfide isomerase
MARIRFSTLLLATLLAACGGTEADPGTEDPPRAPLPTTLRGIDVSGLDRDQREVFFSVVTDVLSPCGEAFSVARCVDEQKSCGSCVPAARFLLRLASEDRSKADLRGAYRDRYARDTVKEIDLEGSPVRGSPMAPITMVEFADFECPYCGELDPVLTELVRIFDGRVRLVFKQFPLPSHPHALSAARAAVAADEQGKFWEIHDALFAHQRALEPVQIAGYLQAAGIDLPRYAVALNGPDTNARVQRDIDLGHRIGVDGTPSLFINGRQYDIQKLGGELPQLRAYIEEELER